MHMIATGCRLPGMYVLNIKLVYALLVSMVTIMAGIAMIPPLLRELGYHSASVALKPVWLLGKSRDPRDRSLWNRIRFYNMRRAYVGGHRGVKW